MAVSKLLALQIHRSEFKSKNSHLPKARHGGVHSFTYLSFGGEQRVKSKFISTF